jgi:hypothetical protein
LIIVSQAYETHFKYFPGGGRKQALVDKLPVPAGLRLILLSGCTLPLKLGYSSTFEA